MTPPTTGEGGGHQSRQKKVMRQRQNDRNQYAIPIGGWTLRFMRLNYHGPACCRNMNQTSPL